MLLWLTSGLQEAILSQRVLHTCVLISPQLARSQESPEALDKNMDFQAHPRRFCLGGFGEGCKYEWLLPAAQVILTKCV